MTICLRVNARVFQSPGSYPWSYYFAIGNNYPEDWSKGMYEGIMHAFITIKTLKNRPEITILPLKLVLVLVNVRVRVSKYPELISDLKF